MAKVLAVLAVVASFNAVFGFPDGGPIDACVKQNTPNHGGSKPQPLDGLPYVLEASSGSYRPGEVLTVKITGAEDTFKGFFVQARDAETDEWIGTFDASSEVKSYEECSAATHTNNEPKESVTLRWRAPRDGSGKVYFVGTLVHSYRVFWTDVIAQVRRN